MDRRGRPLRDLLYLNFNQARPSRPPKALLWARLVLHPLPQQPPLLAGVGLGTGTEPPGSPQQPTPACGRLRRSHRRVCRRRPLRCRTMAAWHWAHRTASACSTASPSRRRCAQEEWGKWPELLGEGMAATRKTPPSTTGRSACSHRRFCLLPIQSDVEVLKPELSSLLGGRLSSSRALHHLCPPPPPFLRHPPAPAVPAGVCARGHRHCRDAVPLQHLGPGGRRRRAQVPAQQGEEFFFSG